MKDISVSVIPTLLVAARFFLFRTSQQVVGIAAFLRVVLLCGSAGDRISGTSKENIGINAGRASQASGHVLSLFVGQS